MTPRDISPPKLLWPGMTTVAGALSTIGLWTLVTHETHDQHPGVLAGALTAGLCMGVCVSAWQAWFNNRRPPEWDHVLDRVGAGRWEWSVDDEKLVTSAAWRSLFGFIEQPLPTGPWWASLLHPDDSEATCTRIHELMRSKGNSAEVACRMRRTNGTWVDVLARIRVERSPSGRVLRLFGTHEDVSERRRRERELLSAIAAIRESEDRVRSYIDHSPVAIFVADRLGRFVDGNPAALELIGHDLPSLLRMRASDLRADAGEPSGDTTDGQLLPGGRTNGELQLRHRDGRVVWVSARTVRISGDRVLAFCADITERREAARVLAEREARYRAVIETSGDGFLITDTDGRILEANDTFIRRSGYAQRELLEMRLDSLQAPDAPHAEGARMPRLLKDGADIFETVQRTADGSAWPVEISVSSWPSAGGRLFVFVRDIRARKRSESLLRMRLRLSEMAKEGNVEALLRVVADEAERFTSSLLASFFLLEADGVRITHQVVSTRTGRVSPAFRHPDLVEEGWAHAIRSDAPIVDNDHRPQPGQPGLDLAGTPLRRVIAVPIRREGRGVALVAVANKSVAYTDDDVAIVTELAALAMDTIGRLQAEDALHQSDARFRQMAETIDEVFWLATPDLRAVLYVNSAFETLFGISIAEVKADPSAWRALVHPADRSVVAEAFRALSQGLPHDMECRLNRADGSTIWVSSHGYPVRDATGKVTLVSGVVSDITVRKHAEHTLEAHQQHLEQLVATRTAGLEEAEARTRLILESTADGIVGISADGIITFANPAACRLTGLSPATLSGRHIAAVLRVDAQDGTLSPLAGVYGDEPIRTEAAGLTTTDGAPLAVELAYQPMFWQGQRVGGVVTLRDISAWRATEQARTEALAAAQRLAQARSEFVANMSHEIRTPLNAVLGFAQMGMRSTPSGANRGHFEHILESGQHLIGIIDEILNYSKLEAGKLSIHPAPYSLPELLDRVVGLVAAAAAHRGLDLHVHEAPNLPLGNTGDLLRMSQVLVNLLSNAVKFTEPGGFVRILVDNDGTALIFRVADTGIGMSEEEVSRLFRPFEQADSSTTRRYGGTGLGLAITHHLVNAMGGSIQVITRRGEGSTFEVRLPVVAPTPALPFPRLRVAVLGLTPREQAWAVADVGERGGVVVDLTEDPDFVLVSGAAFADPETVRTLERAALPPAKVRVIMRPTDKATRPPSFSASPTLQWPLRLRHLVHGPAESMGAAPEAPMRLRGLRILVAEDNVTNQLVLDGLLSGEGAMLVCVDDGPSALERVARDGADQYNLFITDIHMPGMDGYETARGMRALAPDLPIVGLTADALPSDRKRCLAAGMVEHLCKPVDLEPLVAAVLRYHRKSVASQTRDPLVNWTALEQKFQGRGTIVDRLVATVLQSQGDLPTRLSTAAGAGDYKALAFVAHSVAGLAGNLAADSVMALARRTELAAREDRGEAFALADELVGVTRDMLADVAERANRSAVGAH